MPRQHGGTSFFTSKASTAADMQASYMGDILQLAATRWRNQAGTAGTLGAMMSDIQVLDAAAARARLGELAEILADAVNHGASVSFVLPFTLDDATAYWNKVVSAVERRDTILVGAFAANELVGTAQLQLAMPPNQPHRAEVAKVIVHSRARGQGIGRALMLGLERIAIAEKRTLLVLDTVTGSIAEKLYRSIGYTLVGTIPGYALLPDNERLASTSIFYKQLSR